MSALVEYPEAKSVLEDQAKKRMKTNLQAQRAFSVDTLLRNSQDHSSMDSGIVKDEAQDVSEIKAMIEELKNANKVPGKTVWQLIARCEVLQAKLGEKEQEVMNSKDRIRELEQLLFSQHYPKYNPDDKHQLKPTGTTRVTKQFSQDEGRETSPDLPRPRSTPDIKITTPSSDSEDGSSIRTSRINNVFERKKKDDFLEDLKPSNLEDNLWDLSFTNETMIDHQILLGDNEQISLSTTFKDEFCLSDAINFNVPSTIPEESEEDVVEHPKNFEDNNRPNKLPRTCSVGDLVKSGHRPIARLNSAPVQLDEVVEGTSKGTIDFLRMASMNSFNSDETNSRRSSCYWETDGDSEEEVTSS